MDDVIDVPEASKLGGKIKDGRARFSFARALVAILLPVPFAAAVVYLDVQVLRDYGWSLFIGLPFVLPDALGGDLRVRPGRHAGRVLPARHALDPRGHRRDGRDRVEGLICILMLLPLALPVVMLGVMVGYFLVGIGPGKPRDLGKVVVVLVALLPTMVGAEHLTKPEPLLFTCETSVVVDAPPDRVWRHVVSFRSSTPPDDWVFRTGLAYPIRAGSRGQGSARCGSANSPRAPSSSRSRSGTSPGCSASP